MTFLLFFLLFSLGFLLAIATGTMILDLLKYPNIMELKRQLHEDIKKAIQLQKKQQRHKKALQQHKIHISANHY